MEVKGLSLDINLKLAASQFTNDIQAESADIASQLASAFKITFDGAVQESAEITGFNFNSDKDSVVASATSATEVKILSAFSANLVFDTVTVDLDGTETNLRQLILV